MNFTKVCIKWHGSVHNATPVFYIYCHAIKYHNILSRHNKLFKTNTDIVCMWVFVNNIFYFRQRLSNRQGNVYYITLKYNR